MEIECAEKENDDTLWTLALRYARGIGVEKNPAKALEYLNLISKEERYQEILRAELYAAEGRIEIARDTYYIHYNLYGDCFALSELLKSFILRGEKIPKKYLDEAVEYCEMRNVRQLIHTADILIGAGYAEGYYIKAAILYNNDYEFEQKKAAYVLELLKTAAEKGCNRGLRLLCSITAKSQMSVEEKFRVFKFASESGEADGAFYYAELFEKENSSPTTDADSKEPSVNLPPHDLSFTAAAYRGSNPALYRLALNLRKGGVKNQSETYFQALKVVAESERREFAFYPVVARYLLAEAYQYGIGTQKDLDESDVWYESIYTAPQPFLNWMKEENDKERKKILLNLFNHEKRYRLYSRPRSVSLPQWIKRFDEKLWQKHVADDARFRRGQFYVEEAEKYPDNKMPSKKAKALKCALRLGNGKACDVFEKYYLLNELTESRGRIQNLKTGVKLNNPCCMFYLGRHLSNSGDVKLQSDGARLTRLAANRGIDLSAVKNLSLFYEHGTGVNKDLQKYLDLMIDCFDEENIRYFVNSENLLKEFCSSIGYCYYSGKCAERDVRKAALWFRKGADLGCPHCMKNLGWLHFNNKDDRESDALSRRWLEKAVVGGYDADDNTYHNLGYFHQYGIEGECDFLKAVKYYRITYSKFISKENSPESAKKAAKAAFNLGVVYSQQLYDFENAIVWYKKAMALNEDLSTMNNLAVCYMDSDRPDFDAAERIYNRMLQIAPKHSYAIGYAYSNLANIALDRSAKKADYEKARELKKRAAEELEATVKLYESGNDVDFNDSVYYSLAYMYLNSALIERNIEKARLYAVKGAKRGHYEAVNLCKNNGFIY